MAHTPGPYLFENKTDKELLEIAGQIVKGWEANNAQLLDTLQHIQEMAAEAIRTGKAEGTMLYQIEADARAAIDEVKGE